MKYILPLLVLSCFFSAVVAQVTFDKGYFIDNSGLETKCLIKNKDSEKNLRTLIYKADPSAKKQKKSLDEIKEFGVYGFCKYIRASVDVDHSSEDVQLSKRRNPEFTRESVFIKKILSGRASLYSYRHAGITHFYYQKGDSAIQPLVYKKFQVDVSRIGANNSFQQQLWTNFNCNNVSLKTASSLSYQEDDLVKYLSAYNTCMGDSSVKYRTVKNQRFFHLKITPGFTYTTIHFRTGNPLDYTYMNYDFGSKLTYRLGLEAEITLPYNRQKWRLVIESTFQDFESKQIFPQPYTTQLKFKSIEFPIGLRYYSYLTKDLKLFYNAFYISNYSFNFKTKVTSKAGITWELDPISSFALGAGIAWKRLSVEGRYYTNRALFNFLFTGQDTYTRSAVIVGFRIF